MENSEYAVPPSLVLDGSGNLAMIFGSDQPKWATGQTSDWSEEVRAALTPMSTCSDNKKF